MQEENVIQKYRKPLIIIAIGLVIVFIVYSIASSLTFKMTGTTPSLGSVGSISPSIAVTFNKPLSPKKLSVIGSTNLVKNYRVSGKQLIINLNYPTVVGTIYNIRIAHVEATSGSMIKDKLLTFKAQDIPLSQLSAAAQKELINGQDKPRGSHTDPIFAKLPHNTLDYNLSAGISSTDGLNGNKDIVVLMVQLLLTRSDVNTGRDAAIATYKQEVINYIKSIGFDPSKYTIEYEVIESSPQAG